MAYEFLSYYYDELMEGLDYKNWLDLVLKYKKEGTLLDVACGSGTLTVGLSVTGFDVTAFDISEEMLNVLDSKIRINHLPIDSHVGDMRDFSLNKTFDVVTIFVDSLNYLANEEELKSTFLNVFHHLNDDGFFIFDMHATTKIDNQYDGYEEKVDMGDYQFYWKSTKLSEFEVTHHFEFEVDGKILKEDHFQYIYPKETVIALIESLNFTLIETFNTNDRDFYVVKKETL
jgi:SAM-dependent methyltransferase